MTSKRYKENEHVSITKIYVYPVDSTWENQIQSHFGEFGIIETIVYQSKKNFCYAFIQFKDAASASAAIEKRKHNVDGLIVTAKAAHYRHQPKTNNSPVSLLNNDCLMEIFERLSLQDLCSVADVCKSFRAVAKSIFSLRFSDKDIIFHREWSMLRLFGSEIKSLHLSFYDKIEEDIHRTLELIATYCSRKTSALTKMSVYELPIISNEQMERLKPVLSRLTSLQIRWSDNTDFTVPKLLDVCKELVELELESIDFGSVSKKKFEKLKTIRLKCVEGISDYILGRFLSAHPLIKCFEINGWTGKLTSKTFRNFNENLEQLKILGRIEIAPEFRHIALNQLKKLKKLKSLDIECSCLPPMEVFKCLAEAGIPIEELRLSEFSLHTIKSSNAFMPLPTLKELEFSEADWGKGIFLEIVKSQPHLKSLKFNDINNALNVPDIIEIVKTSNELELFEIGYMSGLCIDQHDYDSLLKVIKKRTNATKLKIEIWGDRFCDLSVDDETTIENNRKWLEIIIDGSCSDYYDTDFDFWDDDSDFSFDRWDEDEYFDYDSDIALDFDGGFFLFN